MQTFQYLDERDQIWPIIAYSKSLNLVISGIYKNASSSLELWANNTLDFRIIPYSSKDEILNAPTNTTFITILRDPVERAISAIHMLKLQYRRLGIDVDYNNFTKIEVGYEPHLMPQSVFIPTVYKADNKTYDYKNMWDNLLSVKIPKFWTEALQEYDIMGRLTENNKFAYISEGQDVMSDISTFINVRHHRSWTGINPSSNYGTSKPTISEEYINYLQTVYEYDYKVINSVKFINKGPGR